MLSWIFIVLTHWNNSPWIDMSPHSDTLAWFRANQSLLFLLNAPCGEATNTSFIVFGFTRSELELMIYHTLGEHANYYTDPVPFKMKIPLESLYMNDGCREINECQEKNKTYISFFHRNKSCMQDKNIKINNKRNWSLFITQVLKIHQYSVL